MKLKTLILTLTLTVVMAGVCSAAWAGDIEGKVTWNERAVGSLRRYHRRENLSRC